MITTSMTNDPDSSLELLKRQRSHALFVLSHPKPGHESAFLDWYRGAYCQAALDDDAVLSGQHYVRHEVDITGGQYLELPFHYLGIYQLSLDGADAAESVIKRISALHSEQAAVQPPATWLYYPASEKVGRTPAMMPSLLTIAFANGLPGQEEDFREWYATRHIRHALEIPALVSGQCFESTHFQMPGALEATFKTIAVYEQAGTPESIIESFATLPVDALPFPMLDVSRFSESVYRPV